MSTTERLQTGSATISADADFTDGPWTVHGVAQASEVTRGVSGQPRYWPPDVLQDAAEKLVGTPIVDPDDHDQLDAGQPHPEIVIGEVTDAAFDELSGELIFEGEVDDPDRARQIARGRVDVSPSVGLQPGEPDPDRDAERVAAVTHYRDLAVVTEGAHDSARIGLGTAEALARQFDAADAFQEPGEANDVDVDTSAPEAVVNAAQAALDAKEEFGGAVGDCGTGVGEARAEQIVNDDLQPADFVTRFNDRTPVPAYLSSHEEDAPATDQTPPNWSEEEWTDGCGPVQYALWGGTGTGTGLEWAQRTANEVMAALDEPPIYEGLQRDRARTPDYSGTTEAEWSAPTLGEYLRAYDSLPDPGEVDSVDDLTQADRDLIARKSLLGTPDAETLRELRLFPVVEPSTDELSRRALGAVRSGRGEQADIPDDARASAQRVAGRLLNEEFDAEVDVDATSLPMPITDALADVEDVQQGTLVRWGSSGDRPAYGRIEEVRTEGDDPLTGEIDGDQRITPPAALIEVHRPGEDGFEPSGTMVGHSLNTDTLTVIDELPDPENLSPGDDGPTAEAPSTGGENEDALMSEITDHERELLARARQLDDPTVVSGAEAERLTDHEELLDDAEGHENPTVVETEEHERLADRVATVEELLADALQERTGLSDAAIEAMPFDAMAAEFETEDGDLNVEALTQTPETGTGPSGTGEGLSAEEKDRAEEHREIIETLAGKGGVAAHERKRRAEQLAEITGEDPDTILETHA